MCLTFWSNYSPLYEKALQRVADGLYMLLLWGCTACPSLSLSCSESAFRTIILECLESPSPSSSLLDKIFSLIIISRMDSLLKHTDGELKPIQWFWARRIVFNREFSVTLLTMPKASIHWFTTGKYRLIRNVVGESMMWLILKIFEFVLLICNASEICLTVKFLCLEFCS